MGGPVPSVAGGEPWPMLPTAVPSASAVGLAVPELGSLVVAGHAVELPAPGFRGAGCSVEGGSVAAASSGTVSALGSHGGVVSAVEGSCVETLSSGGRAVAVTGPAVLELPVVAAAVWGLPVEVAMAAGCSVTAVNTVGHDGLAAAQSWDGASLACVTPRG